MSAATQEVRGRPLRLTWGPRGTQVLPYHIASSYSGRVRDVIPRLVAEHIHDPGLREMLSDPHLTYELFSAGPTEGADGLEAPVSPNDDWQQLVRKGQETASELGMALAAQGG